jgi:site-specific DNA-methyltransferase (adenine-specific)
MIELLNCDCMAYMATLKDKAFDLAIVDPPYGIGDCVSSKSTHIHKNMKWNESGPTREYFDELVRVSVNRIIWGANYYWEFIKDRGAIIHDKLDGGSKHRTSPTLSDADIASQSFNNLIKTFRYTWKGNVQGDGINWENAGPDGRIHPTQKPISLYRWCLKNYAKQGDRILDTHLGSGSSAIAAHQMDFDFVGCEIDKDYYDAACKRFKEQTMQTKLF